MCSAISWFALRVRSRSEILTGSVLEQKGFECFVPTFLDSRIYTDRIRKVRAALFPGYVFCRFDPCDSLQVVTTPGVRAIVMDGNTPAPISENEIVNIGRIASSKTARPCPYLNIGQKVRVNQGLFSGLEGFLVLNKGQHRLVVSVDLVQSAISVELDDWQLEPVETESATVSH